MHEQLCSNNEFDKKVRSIVQEELKKINHNIDTDKYTNINDNDLEKKIKNIVALEIDKIKKSIGDTNTPIKPSHQTITQTNQKLAPLTIFIICSSLVGSCFILEYAFGFLGLMIFSIWMFLLLL